jgi:hypothetical protein
MRNQDKGNPLQVVLSGQRPFKCCLHCVNISHRRHVCDLACQMFHRNLQVQCDIFTPSFTCRCNGPLVSAIRRKTKYKFCISRPTKRLPQYSAVHKLHAMQSYQLSKDSIEFMCIKKSFFQFFVFKITF